MTHSFPASQVEAVARAIETARCLDREGPYGGYDYGHDNRAPPPGGRYVVRDFRDPSSEGWGRWVHQTDDREKHEAAFNRLTEHHIAQAALEAAGVGEAGIALRLALPIIERERAVMAYCHTTHSGPHNGSLDPEVQPDVDEMDAAIAAIRAALASAPMKGE